MTRKTLKDLIDTGIREIYIKSYGYVELSLLGSTWQPFGNKARYIRFVVEGYGDYTSRTFFFDYVHVYNLSHFCRYVHCRETL